jgi:hypothetical protein
MREYIQGPDRFYPDRALPKLGASDPGIASLSGTASIELTGTAGASLSVTIAGSAALAVSTQSDLSLTETTTVVRGSGVATTQPRLIQLNDPELARHRESLEEEEVLAILEAISVYFLLHP